MYGGGRGAPVIHFLHDFAKAFGENRRLGEEFLKAVTEARFGSVTKKYPFTRTGMLATNLVSPRVVDGVSKLLVKSDVERLKATDRAMDLDTAEDTMAQGWATATTHMGDKHISKEACYPILGRLFARTVLFLTNKTKQGFEKADYRSFGEIKDKFVAEFRKALPSHVALGSAWGASSSDVASATSAAAAASAEPLVDMGDVSDPKWVIAQTGVRIGKLYYEKAVGHTKGIYTLIEVSADTATLEEYNLGRGDPTTVNVQIEDLLRQWQEFKGERPVVLQPQPKHLAPTSEHLRLEGQKCLVFHALVSHASVSESMSSKLAFCLFPTELRVTEAIPKGKLELTPVTDLKLIHRKASAAASAEVALGDDRFYLQEPPKARSAKVGDWRDDLLLAPYWWVGTTHIKEEANMHERRFTDKESGVSFHVMVNSRSLKVHDRLLSFVAKKEVKPLSSAQPVTKRVRTT